MRPIYLKLARVRSTAISGGQRISNRLAIRLVVGAWCLVALFLGQAYNSTLITYVIAHNAQPLINSIHDIANNPNIHVLVEKGWAMDILFGVM